MVRHAEEKYDFKIPRTSTDENRLASVNSILFALTIFSIPPHTTHSPSAAHLVPHLKLVFSTMLTNSWGFRPVQAEPGFNQCKLSLWQILVTFQRMNSSLITCFLFFSKTVLTNREKEQPDARQMTLPFKHQRHCNRDYKSSCHGESYITAGKLPGHHFFVWSVASHASVCPELNNRSGSTFFIRGR